MKLQIRDLSPPLIGLIIGMPVFVLMNMANLYFQPAEVRIVIEDTGIYPPLFLIGKLLALFFSVFVGAGIAFLVRRVKTPWTLRIMAGLSITLALSESITQNYPLWYLLFATVSCFLAVLLSRIFVYKF